MTNITVGTKSKIRWRNVFLPSALQVGVIGIGVMVDSSAMQWSGFVALVVYAFALLMAEQDSRTGLSFDEARRKIDKLEARERS